MKAYILQRLIALFPILFIISLIVFLISHLIPGDPASVMLGDTASEESVKQLREQMGLNLPLYQQYFNWVVGIFKGDLGYSYFLNESVTTAIFKHLGPTLSLTLLSIIIAVIIAITSGVLSAKRKGTITDHSFMMGTLLGISVPNFLLGLFFILLFSVKLRWFPASGYVPLSTGLVEYIKYLILPSIALGMMHTALIARMTRSAMLDVLNMEYIKTARSKGIKERTVIYKHALRNAFLPILTVIGQSLGTLIAGAVVIETLFAIPGIGQMIIHAVLQRDYTVIQGTVIFITFFYVLINLIVDLLYAAIDPRVRLNKVG